MKYILFLELNLLSLVFSPIPSWKFSNIAVDLTPGETNAHDYEIYSSGNYKLKKYITKGTEGITVRNELKYGSKTKDVQFESIESSYEGQLNSDYIVCPNGNFHVKKYENNNEIDIKPNGNVEVGDDWNLRCYRHDMGYFIITYANNGEERQNLILTRDGGSNWITNLKLKGELYDYKLTQGTNGNNGEYPIMYIGADTGIYMKMYGKKLVLKSGSTDMNGGTEKDICHSLKHTKACFSSTNDSFYYITYNETHLESGYSEVTSMGNYHDLNNFARNHISKSPFSFVDNIEIQSVNLIRDTPYAYYEIYNKDKDITYHGLIDIKNNKVLYNLKEEISTFIPYSKTEMLAITSDSAYKICIIKDGSSCSASCSSNNLLLDSDGNKCQNDCDDGKIKLMPESICVPSSECDTNIYIINDNKCGTCNYFYPEGNKYRLINTNECIGIIPTNAEYYNTELYLLKCKENYYLDNGRCLPNPESCYEKCQTCSEISTDSEDQKCLSCKDGFTLEGENCVIIPPTTVIIPPTTVIIFPTTVITPPTTVITPPTTVIIPPSTLITPPTTVITPPTTVNIPPTTVITPPTTVINPPTTVIIPPTTVIIPPTTVIIPPTTVIPHPTTVITPPTTVITPPTTIITPPTTVITPPTTIPEIKCPLEKCSKCSQESLKLNLCISCNEAQLYKKVNYTLVLTKFVDCLKKEDPKLKSFYYNETLDEYRPCYKTCKKCLKGGDAESQHCLECETNYMLRPGYNPKNNCVAYTEFYYFDAYNRFKSLNALNCPEEAKYVIKEKKSCIDDCKKDEEYKYLYSGKCLKSCPKGTKNSSFICLENPNKSYLGVNELYLKSNDSLDIIETLVNTYISEFGYTPNHATLYNSEFYNILLYKSPKILNDLDLKMAKVDFKNCYDKVKQAYGIQGDLVISVTDKKNTNNPASYYSFFHPTTGKKLEAESICKEETIVVKENLTSILNENDTKYELQTSLTSQGINIFDPNDPFYTDLCFDFKNPKKRDIPLRDRIKNVFPNITLCDEGCQNDGINLEDMTVSCNCKFNDIANNNLIKENAVLDNVVGEIFDLINSSNILVVKCYNYILKHFKDSIGGILTSIIIGLDLILTYAFFGKQFPKISAYIFSITNRYLSYISNPSNMGINFPPKKNEKNKEKKENKIHNRKSSTKFKLKFGEPNKEKKTHIENDLNEQNEENPKIKKRKSLRKRSTKITYHDNYLNNNNNNYNYYNPIGSTFFLDENQIIKNFVSDYLETSPDEMEYDDAIKKDKRTFCEYFRENLKEKQIIANTFIAEDPIKPRGIKLILFTLNLILYFVINGLFISEDYISELYYLDEENENFFSFFPRSIEILIYTTIVSIIIGYITSFFFLEEAKIKGIFKRDVENKVVLFKDIINLIKTLKKRYISFIIFAFVVLLISLYYLLCFNYVYPKTQIEWIKSSVAIFIIIQILSILKILLQAILRFISFKCESEKLFHVSKFLG